MGTAPPVEQCKLPPCADIDEGVMPVGQAQGTHLEVMPTLLYIPALSEERKPLPLSKA